MRLIDSDMLKAIISNTYYKPHEVIGIINRRPTVEAIPIEWIKKYIEDNTQVMVNPKYEDTEFTGDFPIDYYDKVYPHQVKAMLEAWEEENDKMSEM